MRFKNLHLQNPTIQICLHCRYIVDIWCTLSIKINIGNLTWDKGRLQALARPKLQTPRTMKLSLLRLAVVQACPARSPHNWKWGNVKFYLERSTSTKSKGRQCEKIEYTDFGTAYKNAKKDVFVYIRKEWQIETTCATINWHIWTGVIELMKLRISPPAGVLTPVRHVVKPLCNRILISRRQRLVSSLSVLLSKPTLSLVPLLLFLFFLLSGRFRPLVAGHLQRSVSSVLRSNY